MKSILLAIASAAVSAGGPGTSVSVYQPPARRVLELRYDALHRVILGRYVMEMTIDVPVPTPGPQTGNSRDTPPDLDEFPLPLV